jgi:hypothetical protein
MTPSPRGSLPARGLGHARSQGQGLDQPRAQTVVAYMERLSQSNARCGLGTVLHRHHRDGVLVFVVVTKLADGTF